VSTADSQNALRGVELPKRHKSQEQAIGGVVLLRVRTDFSVYVVSKDGQNTNTAAEPHLLSPCDSSGSTFVG
jgi:hypothetical protein